MEAYVKSSIENGIATIEFFTPASNSLPGLILKQLAETITNIGKNENAKVIVLKSSGEKAFCAGASFDELIAIDSIENGKSFFMGFANVINAMRLCPKFIIARVQGKAVGGGVGLACAADYTLALKSASIKLSELAVGIGPFVVGPAVERKIGSANAYAIAINASEWYSADWAKEKGLYADTFDTIDELDAAIKSLTEKLSKSNPEAMELIKKAFWRGTENWDTLLAERAAMSGTLVLSEFTKNFIQQFKGK